MTEFTLNRAMKIPLIGPWLSRVSHVADILATPCAVSPEIWVEAGFFGAGQILMAFTKPFLIAWTWERFGRSHRKGRRLKQIWDFINEIEGIYEMPEGFGWQVFGVAADLALKLEWYFLLINEATKGAVIWTSLAYEWSGCQAPGDPYCNCALVPGPMALLPPQTGLVNAWHPTEERIFSGGGDVIATPNGYSASCGFSIQQTRNPFFPTLPDAPTTFALIEQLTSTDYGDTPAGKTSQGIVSTFMHRDYFSGTTARSFAVRLTKGFGVTWCSAGTFTATGTNFKGKMMRPDP